MDTLIDLFTEATGQLDAAIAFRRDLHQHPELGLELPRTQAAILAALSEHDLDLHVGTALSSVTAVLSTGRPGPTVLLRADMDALPMDEDTDLPFKSAVAGAMHACCLLYTSPSPRD